MAVTLSAMVLGLALPKLGAHGRTRPWGPRTDARSGLMARVLGQLRWTTVSGRESTRTIGLPVLVAYLDPGGHHDNLLPSNKNLGELIALSADLAGRPASSGISRRVELLVILYLPLGHPHDVSTEPRRSKQPYSRPARHFNLNPRSVHRGRTLFSDLSVLAEVPRSFQS